ncbi:MAG TPA: hypothetical protein DCE44_17260, partial [Verrucomicrobiales bacterium]|nr:hypothetical protein [Verrucomicrobiales bacterium]
FQIAQAFTRLADWHLTRGDNPQAARATLEEIVQRCADTPFARTAENRIRQLPRDEAELQELRKPRVIRLPSLRETAPGELPVKASAQETADARTEVATLKSRLDVRPDDWKSRIRLAQVLAERLGQIDAAVAELGRVRQLEGLELGLHAEALALEAAWRLKRTTDQPRARQLLEKIVSDYPSTPQAIAARRQLEVMDHPETYRQAPPPPPPPPRIVVRLPEPPAV